MEEEPILNNISHSITGGSPIMRRVSVEDVTPRKRVRLVMIRPAENGFTIEINFPYGDNPSFLVAKDWEETSALLKELLETTQVKS